MTSISEFRELEDRELLLRRYDVVQELVVVKFHKATGQLDNTARPKQLRRDLARINTVIRERERAQDLAPGGLVAQVGSLKDDTGKGYTKIQERFGVRT